MLSPDAEFSVQTTALQTLAVMAAHTDGVGVRSLAHRQPAAPPLPPPPLLVVLLAAEVLVVLLLLLYGVSATC